MKKRMKPVTLVSQCIIWAVVIILTLSCLLPLLNMVAISFSGSDAVAANQVGLIPKDFNVSTYQKLLGDSQFWRSFLISVIRVILGTLINMFFTVTMAYPLSKSKHRFHARDIYMKIVIFAMLFNGGIIPLFLTMQSLGLYNSLWSLILNLMLSAYNVVIVRSYFSGLPVSIVESARIDGANDFIILFRLIIPLSKPVLATVALWVIVGHWNDYLNPLMFLSDRQNYTLQLILKELVLNAESSIHNISVATSGSTAGAAALGQQTRNAVLVVAMIPMVILYPFVQRYFVGGVTLGAVKE